MAKYHLSRRISVLFIGLFFLNLCVNGQDRPKNPAAPSVRSKDLKKANIKTFDLSVSLKITDLRNDRYELTATVVNNSKYDRAKGGTLVFSREGHGEPLPPRFGESISKAQKWGHQRIADRNLPALKAGGSISFNVETNGRGDFYAHLEGIILDNNTANNRSDITNLRKAETRLDSSVINGWFFPYTGPQTAAVSRLHGTTGSVEIPGLLPRTTFSLPKELYDQRFLVRTKVALAAKDINLSQSRVFIGKKLPFGTSNEPDFQIPGTWFWIEIQWETNGIEFDLGGDALMRSLYPSIHYLDLRPSEFSPFQLFFAFQLKFDQQKQLFRLEGLESYAVFDLVAGLSTDGRNVTSDQSLKTMFHGLDTTIRKKMATAIAAKRSEVEWYFNKRMREIVLTDEFGNTGAIDKVNFDGPFINWTIRTP